MLITMNGTLKAVENSKTKSGKNRYDLKILNETSWEIGSVMYFGDDIPPFTVGEPVHIAVTPVVNGSQINYFLAQKQPGPDQYPVFHQSKTTPKEGSAPDFKKGVK